MIPISDVEKKMKKKLRIRNGNVVFSDCIRESDIQIENGVIKSFDVVSDADYEEFDAHGLFVLPGFIDVHTHGGNGVDINNADEEQLKKLSLYFASQGVTGYLPAVITDSHEKICESLEKIAHAINDNCGGAKILGIHMEGPYLSREFCGAMPDDMIIDCCQDNFSEYETASQGNIKLITVAAENKGILDFIKEAVSKGIVVSLGHTGAEYDQCIECINAGARCSTHTFNAMRPLHQHHPSIIGAALETDVYCEAICDGRHLHPAIFRLLLKTKGIDKVIAVTDSIMAAGLPDGAYKLGKSDITVINGDARISNSSARAGSTLTMIDALRNIMQFTGLPLDKCMKMMAANPARLLGIYDMKGEIALNKDADLVIVDRDLNVIYTIAEGELVFSKDLFS